MIQLTEQLRLNLNSNLNMNLNLQWKLKLRLTSCSYLCVMWEKQKGFRALRTFPDCKPFVFTTLTLDKVFLVLRNERKTRQWSSQKGGCHVGASCWKSGKLICQLAQRNFIKNLAKL